MPDAQEVYRFLVGDFESMWRAMVERAIRLHKEGAEPAPAGNFLFALLGMVFLEFIGDATKPRPVFVTFCEKLNERNPRYFAELPDKVPGYGSAPIPKLAGKPKKRMLIAALFQLIRNGHAHKYHQISLELKNGNTFGVSVTGADHEAPLEPGTDDQRRALHLTERSAPDTNDVWLCFCPDVFYSDVKWAAEEAGVYDSPHFIFKPWSKQTVDYDAAAVRSALVAADGS